MESPEFAKTYAEISAKVEQDLLKQTWYEGRRSKAKSILENPYSINNDADRYYAWREGFESKGKAIKSIRNVSNKN